ncbi:hypothetical protein RHMOL_Rhmol03G0189600 [Rhododendron molle]|uniref:Uncharacterized protein n=1 Tax=Rhododendron molle TaxID=49168 RepID=A0ACC0PHM9_RHOML|nr:hypothetical protein RHMOL_Rhmol03G0189600 [Rhododendron molle]
MVMAEEEPVVAAAVEKEEPDDVETAEEEQGAEELHLGRCKSLLFPELVLAAAMRGRELQSAYSTNNQWPKLPVPPHPFACGHCRGTSSSLQQQISSNAHTSVTTRKTTDKQKIPFIPRSTIKATARAISASAPEAATMVKAIRVHELGGPEVLKWEDVEIGEPKEGEILVKNKAIGLNFVDVYFRKGVYKASTMPFTPGREAAGVVTAVGPGLTGRKVGDVVAYAGNPMGSYAEEQILPAERVVPVPPSLDPIVAASVILKGMTVHMLVRRCFKVEPGHTVLVHAAAGGVGSLLCQWANSLGATVIGTVSTTEKAAQAKEDGCHHVIMYKEEDFVTRVNEITSGKGVDVVYDSVGKDTFQSSGMPDPLPMTELAAKSLFLTRASLFSYTATRDELLQAAGEVFSNVASGILRVRINHKYPLSQVAQAHEDLEGRKTSGSVVLIPDGEFEQ